MSTRNSYAGKKKHSLKLIINVYWKSWKENKLPAEEADNFKSRNSKRKQKAAVTPL